MHKLSREMSERVVTAAQERQAAVFHWSVPFYFSHSAYRGFFSPPSWSIWAEQKSRETGNRYGTCPFFIALFPSNCGIKHL